MNATLGSPVAPPAYWAEPADRLLVALAGGPDGLDAAEARRRAARRSAPRRHRAVELARLFLLQFANPLVLILIFGAGVSAVLGDAIDTGIIAAILLGSALLSCLQEYRASEALERLRLRLSLKATVLRAGVETAVDAAQVAEGDVLVLSAGALVPADGIVLAAKDLLVSEAALTGESYPVEKRPGVADVDTALSDRFNCVYQGTSVRSGTARVLVVTAGAGTEFGRIGARLRAPPPETDFARGLRHFGLMLTRVMLVIVVLVLAANAALGRPLGDTLLFAVALAVGLSPELLPAIVSVTLAAGARRMAQRGVLVRRLEAIENLGSMDILCTDKTGTLTVGVAALHAATDPAGERSGEVLRLAHLNAAFETGIENPLDAAIVAAGQAAGLVTDGWHKVDEIPYDFLRRRLTVVMAATQDPASHLMVTKGAVEPVLSCCTSIGLDAEQPLTEEARAALIGYYRARGAEGLRVLGVAARRLPPRPAYGRDDEAGLAFAGFVLLRDPARADAARTVGSLRQRGVRTKMVTGDNRFVAASVAAEVGLSAGSVLTGSEIGRMSDEALWHRARRTEVFAEVDPQQKERIIRALRRSGHVVGFLGDGVNDAPALHAADVGISVEGAVDIARESADIVLLQPDLGVLRQGIEDGRRTFANTQKYIAITTSANFGNMLSMAVASLALPFLPLLAKQILLNNFLSDFPSMAISADGVDPEAVRRPPRWRIADTQRFMLLFGAISSAFDLLTFAALLLVFQADETLFQTGWFVVSLLTELAVVLVLRTHRSALRSRPAPLLLWATATVAAAAVALPYAGPLAGLLGFKPLPVPVLLTLAAIVGLYVLATEFAKRRFYRHRWARRR